jgi:PAS domain S-box-containing protein
MLKNLSLRIKLSLAFLLVAMLVAGVGYYQVTALRDAQATYEDLVENDFTRFHALDDIKVALSNIEKSAHEHALADGDTDHVDTDSVDSSEKQLNKLYADYEANLEEDAEQPVTGSTVKLLRADTDNMLIAARAYIGAIDGGNKAEIEAGHEALTAASVRANENLDALIGRESKLINDENEHASSSVSQVLQTVVLLVIGVAVIAALLGLVIADVLSRSLKRLKHEAQFIASGDFTRQVPVVSKDEIGQVGMAFNDMSGRLRDSYQRLAVETERTKTLLESLAEGVMAIDDKSNVGVLNTQAQNLLDLPERDKIIGSPIQQAVSLADEKGKILDANELPLLRAMQSKQVETGVFIFKKRDGTTIKLEIVASPIVVEEKVIGAIMNLRDVTKEKEIDRMKTEFISLASHQLRTPLSAIKWFSEMLLSGDAGKLTPEQEEFARNVAESTERMIALVNALLNISRIESGRIMVDPTPTDLRELVSGIVNDLRAKTEERKQTLVISVHEGLPKINVDPRLIGQVYLNLLSNAIKYTPKGGEISVFISRKENEIISQVADNGYGIPKEQQGRIFQKFFRATNAAKVETDGTGLGLYLIKAIVESSGGRIWFESEEGKGTTFWFSIPATGMQAKEGEVTLDM